MNEHDGLTPAQRALRARIAAHALHAQGGTNTKPATAAFLDRFARQVDPDAALPPDERARRAAHARKAYMQALALKASRARTRRKVAGRLSGAIDSALVAFEEATDSETAAAARDQLADLEDQIP